MKVAALIEALMEYPLDMEVKVIGYGQDGAWDGWEEPDLDTEYLPGSIVIL